MAGLIGTKPHQVPLNQFLGGLAYKYEVRGADIAQSDFKTINGISLFGSGNISISGGSASVYSGMRSVDFGSHPGSNEAFITVTGQTSIVSTSNIKLFISGEDTTVDHSANDHRWFANFVSLTYGSIIDGTGFTIYINSTQKLSGVFKVRFEWS